MATQNPTKKPERQPRSSAGATLALFGGSPVGTPTPPVYPVFTVEARRRVDQLLATGEVVAFGKTNSHIRAAEEKIAAWHGVDHCLTTSSGHAALHAALIGLEITNGYEVITSPYSWGASVSCILHNGAIPVFADVLPDSGLLDPASIESLISTRTRAILVPHIYGQPADLTRIMEIARRHSLRVIEDCSQAHGARHRGERVGTYGDASGFSCMGKKLLAATEAGFMLTNRSDVYWNAAILCQHPGGSDEPGRTAEAGFPGRLAPFIDSLLYTYRSNPISAVLLETQLDKLDRENAGRRANRKLLVEKLDGIRSVSFPIYDVEDEPVYHILTLNHVSEYTGISRDLFLSALVAEGIPAFTYVACPLHQSPRLAHDYSGPLVMWSENIQRAGKDYGRVSLPGCDTKVACSLELNWNYIKPAPDAVDIIAKAFIKVEENLDVLRRYDARRA